MLADLSLGQFIREVGSDSPVPGGGSVSALAGAQAASLISMYCRLSLHREKYAGAAAILEEVDTEASGLSEILLRAADEDAAAFSKVMDALRLPKGTEEDISRRRQATREAATGAARVPLYVAEHCLRMLKLIEAVAGRGNQAAVTDLGVGNLQALAGLVGACYNVRINLHYVKGSDEKEKLSARVASLLKEGRDLFEQNRVLIEQSF